MRRDEEFKESGSFKAALGSSSSKTEKKLEQIISRISGKKVLRIDSSRISCICWRRVRCRWVFIPLCVEFFFTWQAIFL